MSPLVDVTELVTVASRRWVFRMCRTGKVAGAVKIGRRWLVDREAFRSWASTGGKTASTPDAIDDELRAAGFR